MTLITLVIILMIVILMIQMIYMMKMLIFLMTPMIRMMMILPLLTKVDTGGRRVGGFIPLRNKNPVFFPFSNKNVLCSIAIFETLPNISHPLSEILYPRLIIDIAVNVTDVSVLGV